MRSLVVVMLAASTLIVTPVTSGCPMEGEGHGKGRQLRHGKKAHASGGHGMNCRMDASHDADMEIFHYLIDHRDSITRSISVLDNGVETITESDDPEVVEKIRIHVAAMKSRLDKRNPIHMRDPLFAEIFANADKIEMEIESTDKGVRVRETSEDDHVAKMIQAHADVIEKFIENGRPEMRKNHEIPGK